MSKQNRRSGGSFRTLGQRMLSFGRGVMRTYEGETSLQPDTTTSEPAKPRGQWRSMTTDSLVWRQEQPAPPASQPPAQNPAVGDDYYESDYANYDDMGMPIQRASQPQRQQPIQRQPQPSQPPKESTPTYIKTKDGTPVRTSQNKFSDPVQRRLNAIAAAHEAKNAERDQQRDQKIENIQRKVESGELNTRRRRGSIDVDYVQTESLLPAEERGKPSETPVQRQESTDAGDTADNAPAEESNWFDEVPDDDADIDNLAGFESTDDSIQRMPDDLPVFDASSLNEEEASDDMGEFEGGYDNFTSGSADSNTVINRDYDEDDESPSYTDFGIDSVSSPDVTDMPVQRTTDDYDYDALPTFDDFDNDETVPLIPSIDAPDVTPTPSMDAPVQRDAYDDVFTPNDDSEDAEQSYTDFSDLGSSSNEAPVQRDAIQREEIDYTDSDYEDYDEGDAYTDYSDVESPTNEAPVQRNYIQRDEMDYSADDDVSYDEGDSYTDYSDVESPTSEAPVQRNYIQRDEMDYSADDEASYDEGNSYTDYSDVESPTNEAPVQRNYIQRDEMDYSADDDASYDEGDSYTDYSDVESPTNEAPPVQRNYIQREETNYNDGDYADYDEGDSYIDYSDVESPTNEAPVHRNYIQREETNYDAADYDYDDDSDYNQSPDFDITPTDTAPLQRDYDDDGDFDFDNSSDFSQPSSNDAPVQRNSIQRTELDVDDFDAPTDFDDSAASPDDVAPAESLSIAPSADNTPVQRRIQRDTPDTPDNDLPVDTSPTHDVPVQRQPIDHPDLGDGGDYSDLGDATWAEMNDYSPATNAPMSDTPIQRADYDEPSYDYDDGGYDDVSDVDYADDNMPEVGDISNDAPVQRDTMQRADYDEPSYDDDDYGDVSDVDYADDNMPEVGDISNDAPVQRDTMQHADYDEPSYDYADYDAVSDVDYADDNMPDSVGDVSNAAPPVQRDTMQRADFDEPSYDYDDGDYGDYYDDNDTPEVASNDAPIQRHEMDMAQSDDAIEPDFNTNESLSIQPSAIQRSEMDERTFEIIDNPESLSTQPPMDSQPVQRDIDETYDNYEDYGDQTWAEMNDYSPATDSEMSSDNLIQRDLEDTAPYAPYHEEDDFDHLEDTDGETAMNILGDYVSEQTNPGTSSVNNNPAIQRREIEESYDYLPEDFDPTPTIYDFNQTPDATPNATPTNDAPIQRSYGDEFVDEDMPSEQPMDLFSALSEAGMINNAPSPELSTPSIQRDYQDDTYDDYDEYGDATWAELNDYSPATDHAINGDTPIQRSYGDEFADEDMPSEQPMDLFSALSAAGMTGSSNQRASDAPIQRDFDDVGGDGNEEMMDLYNAMLQSGMIQDSSQKASPSSNSEPIQRSAQPSNESVVDALMRASQVSESSSANRESTQSTHTTRTETPVTNVISRAIPQSDSEPVAPNDRATSPDTNVQETDDKIEQEDKEYLSQLARDVFRVIKRRLREEKERRG